MNKFASIAFVLAFVVISASVGFSFQAHAQTAMTMPALYNQAGTEVNVSGTLPAGWYFTQSNGTGNQVYYYGNGTFYDPSTGTYGGSVSNPNGTAGVIVGTTVTPGVPNTGAGGNAALNWTLLILSGVVVAAGAAYLTAHRSTAQTR